MVQVGELKDVAPTLNRALLSVGDAVWIVAALFQRHLAQTGDHESGGVIDLMAHTVMEMKLTSAAPQSILQHLRQHCVADKPAQPNRACYLSSVSTRERRLYRRGDPMHPSREGGPTHPKWERLPEQFKDLRDWYETVWNAPSAVIANDPLLNAIGSGSDLWKNVSPDAYVHELRDAWGERG